MCWKVNLKGIFFVNTLVVDKVLLQWQCAQRTPTSVTKVDAYTLTCSFDAF
jgi:hypothetical protein